MLAPNEALGKARIYLGEVIPDFAELDPKVDEMRLVNGSCWKITFYAYHGDEGKADTIADLLRRHRIEKVVSVASEDGSLIAVENPSF
jgi:hypothetical protein